MKTNDRDRPSRRTDPDGTSWITTRNMRSMLRALQFAGGDSRDELMKELVDFWAKELAREGDLKFDEQTLRDALLRKLKLTPRAPTPHGQASDAVFHSGSGLPRVSGAKGKASRPTRNTEHIVIPAYRIGSG